MALRNVDIFAVCVLKRMKVGGQLVLMTHWWRYKKSLEDLTVDFLTRLINKRLERERMPEERRRCVLVQIFEDKGDVQSCGNYRGIKSMSRVMKLRGNSRS